MNFLNLFFDDTRVSNMSCMIFNFSSVIQFSLSIKAFIYSRDLSSVFIRSWSNIMIINFNRFTRRPLFLTKPFYNCYLNLFYVFTRNLFVICSFRVNVTRSELFFHSWNLNSWNFCLFVFSILWIYECRYSNSWFNLNQFLIYIISSRQ